MGPLFLPFQAVPLCAFGLAVRATRQGSMLILVQPLVLNLNLAFCQICIASHA
jgi:hypothetical protein